MAQPPPLPNRAQTQRIGVEKIAKLVEGRDAAPMEEIAKIIDDDKAITGQLMQRAYPRAPAREGATVQMATSRVGVNYVIVLLVTDLLRQYVLDIFEQLVELPLSKDDPAVVPLSDPDYLVGSICFHGKATGKASFYFSNTMSLVVANHLLEEGMEMSEESIRLAVGKVVSHIGERLSQGLNEGRLPCTVEAPEVALSADLPREPEGRRGINEDMYFRHANCGLRVRLHMGSFL